MQIVAHKELRFNTEARRALEAGVNKLADAVRITLGPKGQYVVLDKKLGSPTITNDGVTIAREIELEDIFENQGAQLVKEVATKTNDVAGDGTTTATVLAQVIVREGLKNVAAGANPVILRSGVEKAVEAAVEAIKAQSTEISGKEEISRVGAISARSDEVGEVIADAIDKVGKDGVVNVEESQTFGMDLEFTEGMQFDKGYLSPYFVTDQDRMEAVLDDPYILIANQKIGNVQDVLPLLNQVMHSSKPLLIVSEDVEGEALATLIVNKLRGTFNAAAVKAPGFGDRRKRMLEDIAILTGGEVITEELGLKLENTQLNQLGRARKVVITKDETTLVDGAGATETELKEKKHRVEDALSATRAALEEGIVPGGGVAFLHAQQPVADMLDSLDGDERTGARIIHRALEEPIRQIARNAGADGSIVVDKVRTEGGNMGFNALVGEYQDLIAAGVTDPTMVSRSALQNAASIGSLIVTTDVIVAEPEEEAPAMPAGGMGGMM